MAKPELGTKRQCLSCGTRFYDLHKDPILCPKCGEAFQPAALARALPAAAAVEEDEVEVVEAGPELVSLDDVAADEAVKETGDDIDLGDEAEDDTFLEEEEEGGDVADLIDGDIEDDEET